MWGSCPDVAGAISRQNKAKWCKWQLRCNQRLDRLVLIKALLGAARELGFGRASGLIGPGRRRSGLLSVLRSVTWQLKHGL